MISCYCTYYMYCLLTRGGRTRCHRMPDGRHATAGACSLGVLPLGTAPGVSKTCGDGCGPQPARSDTDRALRPSQPGCILYVVVHKFILNAATGGCPGGRSEGRLRPRQLALRPLALA